MLTPTPLQRLWRHYLFAARCIVFLLPLLLLQAQPLPGHPLLLIAGVTALGARTDSRRACLVGALCGAMWGVYSDRSFGLHLLLLAAVGYLGGRLPHRLLTALLLTAAGAAIVWTTPTAFMATLLVTPLLYVLSRFIFCERRTSRGQTAPRYDPAGTVRRNLRTVHSTADTASADRRRLLRRPR